MKKNKPILGSAMLLTAAIVWGFAFVFQSTSMDLIGPLTLTSIRMLLGGLVLLPICFLLNRNMSRTTIKKTVRSGLICGVVLLLACTSQQYGLLITTVGKAGFITALYIVLVPIIAALVLRKKVTLVTWICVITAMLGFYFLSFTPDGAIGGGDALVFLSAILYSVHILTIDHFTDDDCDGTLLSCVQFLTAGVLSFLPMLLIEQPSVEAVMAAKIPILYMGLCSCGIAYTFQVLGQAYVPPVQASLIMCLESVFAAIGGAIVLNERFSTRETLGCILLFGAVLAVNLFQAKSKTEVDKNG